MPTLLRYAPSLCVLLAATPLSGAQTGSIAVADLLEARGHTAFDRFGKTVSRAGDVNADGFADFMAASSGGGAGPGSPSYVLVISGRSGAVLHEFRGLASDETLFGTALDAAGDVNDDGFDDLIIGSPNPDLTAPIFGSVYVFSGADGALLHRFVEEQFNGDFGRAVSGAGDVDGDGSDDVVVGSPLAANTRGFARIFSGADGTTLRTFYGVGGEHLGAAVSELGDLNADGTPDIVIGSPNGIPGSCPSCIRAVSGFDGAPLLTITNGDALSMLGASVAAAGDLTGDGIPDILAGAPEASIFQTGDGAAYLFSGADGSVVYRWTDRAGEPLPSAFGSTLSGRGDIDGDGIDDIVVGAPTAKGHPAGISRGVVYGFSGADGSRLFRAAGQVDRDTFGTGASIIGDADGDGFADVAAGASFASVAGPQAGKVRLLRRVARNGETLCVGEANSAGRPSLLTASSLTDFEAAANDTRLTVTELPPNVPGFFLVSPDFHIIRGIGGGEGTLCIASTNIGRYSASINVSSPAGDVSFDIDTMGIPLPSGGAGGVAVSPGDTYNFQFWHRDTTSTSGVTSNLSSAVTITFQ